jgi:hypothetical protein
MSMPVGGWDANPCSLLKEVDNPQIVAEFVARLANETGVSLRMITAMANLETSRCPRALGVGLLFCRNVNERHAAQESKAF